MTEEKRKKDSLTGRIRFTEDIYSKRMLIGKIIRSRISSGTIKQISWPKTIPPEITIITSKDIPGRNGIVFNGTKIPVLTSKNIQYKGEPIALIAGPEPEILDEVISQIKIEYEKEKKPNQIFLKRNLIKGDAERIFQKTAKIVEGNFTSPTEEYYAPGISSAYALKEGEGMSVYCSTQWPSHIQKSIARVLDIEEPSVKLICRRNTYSMDSRVFFPEFIAVYTVLLAQASKKPVKINIPEEDLHLYGPRRIPTIIHHKAAVTDDGKLEALDVEINMDFGAYPFFVNEALDRMCMAAAGNYHCRHLRITAKAWKSPNSPRGPFSGMGDFASFFAIETQTNRIAEIFQIPPDEWKRKNFLQKNNKFPSGGLISRSLPLEEIMDKVLIVSDFKRKYAAFELQKKRRLSIRESLFPQKGIGLASAYQGSDFLRRDRENIPMNIIIRLETDGRLNIFIPVLPESIDLVFSWKKLASNILGIQDNDIIIRSDDSEHNLSCGPSVLSRNITITTRLIEQSCLQIKKKRFRDPLPITIKKVFKKTNSRPWNTENMEGIPFLDITYGVCAIEVAVDPISLQIRIVSIWICIDAGRILNLQSARKTVEAGLFQAMGLCLTERPIKSNIPMTYISEKTSGIPGILDKPRIAIQFIESKKNTPYKGLGEIAQNCFAPAFVSAVSQATGFYFHTIPITEKDIYNQQREEN